MRPLGPRRHVGDLVALHWAQLRCVVGGLCFCVGPEGQGPQPISGLRVVLCGGNVCGGTGGWGQYTERRAGGSFLTWRVGEVDGEVERVGDEDGEDGDDKVVVVVALCVEEEDVVAEVLSEDDEVTKESRLAGVVEVVVLW